MCPFKSFAPGDKPLPLGGPGGTRVGRYDGATVVQGIYLRTALRIHPDRGCTHARAGEAMECITVSRDWMMQQCDTNVGSVHHETLGNTNDDEDESALEQLHVWCQYRPDDSLGSFGGRSAEQICEGALQAAEKNSQYLPLLHRHLP